MNQPHTFLDIYTTCIRPRLAAIDLFLREAEPPYAPATVAELLALDPMALLSRLPVPSLACIDRPVFLHILKAGDSYICGLFNRELMCGAPYIYTKEDIAYIYGLAPAAVQSACDTLGIRKTTALRLPSIFAQIPLRDAVAPNPD